MTVQEDLADWLENNRKNPPDLMVKVLPPSKNIDRKKRENLADWNNLRL